MNWAVRFYGFVVMLNLIQLHTVVIFPRYWLKIAEVETLFYLIINSCAGKFQTDIGKAWAAEIASRRKPKWLNDIPFGVWGFQDNLVAPQNLAFARSYVWGGTKT
jgi:hypothetical protein